MKFGVFYEHQLPRPWAEDSEYRLIQDALELSLGPNRENFVKQATAEIEHALTSHPRRSQILDGFYDLAPERVA